MGFSVKKENWLLLSGVVFFCACIVSFFFLDLTEFNSRLIGFEGISFQTFTILAVIAAPLWEEITFRGLFVKNKYLVFLGYILLFAIVIYSGNIMVYPLFVFFLLLKFLVYQNKVSNSVFVKAGYVLNALIFAVIHYELYDFAALNTYFYLLSQFSAGLILIWITINYNLFRSILFHAGFNLITVIVAFYSLQYPDTSKRKIETKNLKIEYCQTPVFTGSSSIECTEDHLEAKSARILTMMDILDLVNSGKGKTTQIHPFNSFAKYSFKIYKKKGYQGKINYNEVKNGLIKEGLIWNPQKIKS